MRELIIAFGLFLFVEGESRKVGQVFIPQTFANAMKSGKLVLLSAELETRISRIVEEYNICDEQSIQQIDSILQSLKVALGKVKIEQLCLWLKQGKIENIVHMLLVDYYDPMYNYQINKKKNRIIFQGNSRAVFEYLEKTV